MAIKLQSSVERPMPRATGPLYSTILAVCLACTASLTVWAEAPTPEPAGATSAPTQAPAWLSRRAEFAHIVNALNPDDPATFQPFMAILTEFEKKPFTRTPMENMEILGVYYLPRDGIESTLTYIAANAALGWYDALRFTSESGRAEILHNEGFFKLPFVLAGPEFSEQAVQFFETHPEKTAQLVREGLAIANTLKHEPRYDHQWPSAYGLERTLCALGADCSKPSPATQAIWAQLWEDTQERVMHYYRINR